MSYDLLIVFQIYPKRPIPRSLANFRNDHPSFIDLARTYDLEYEVTPCIKMEQK